MTNKAFYVVLAAIVVLSGIITQASVVISGATV